MTNRQSLNRMLSDIAADLDLPFLKLDGRGLCSFETLEGLAFIIEAPEFSELVFLLGRLQIMPTDTEDRVRLQQFLLEQNSLFHDNQGASYTIHPRENCIYLQYSFPIPLLETGTLANIINNFVGLAGSAYEQLEKNFYTPQKFMTHNALATRLSSTRLKTEREINI